MNTKKTPRGRGLRSVAELMAEFDEREALPANDPNNPYGYKIDGDWVTLWWGGHDYNIASHRIDTPEKLLGWLRHICEKTWSGTTPERIANLIAELSDRHSWITTGM